MNTKWPSAYAVSRYRIQGKLLDGSFPPMRKYGCRSVSVLVEPGVA